MGLNVTNSGALKIGLMDFKTVQHKGEGRHLNECRFFTHPVRMHTMPHIDKPNLFRKVASGIAIIK